MTTTNVPSDKFEDLKRDVEDATRYSNSTTPYINRVGQQIRPIPLQAQDIADNITASEQAIANSGFIPKGDFTTGGTVEAKNEVFSDGTDYWRYDGSLPFTVTAGSSPTPTGVGAWINVTDGTLRSQLAAIDSTVLIGGVEAGVIADNVIYLKSYESLVTGGDWTAAFAAAYSDLVAQGGGTLEMPVGTLTLSGTGFETLTASTYYSLSNAAIRLKGQGFGTILTRGENQATDVIDINDQTTFHDSVLNIHNSNNIFEDFVIRDSKSAIYMGQKDGEVDTCSVVFNKFKNVWVVDCGIGLHMRSGVGNYYNSFEDTHIWQCQIGAYIDKHPSSLIVPPNNNRNQMRHVRTARCHVGLWIKMGDTNQFMGQHNEGNTLTPSNNRYSAPTLPLSLTGGIGQLLEEDAINNQFVACMQESCEVELVNNGDRNSFSGLYRDEVSGKVRHLKVPTFYSTRTMSVTNAGQTFFFTNLQSDIFAGYEAGVEHSTAPLKSVRLTSTDSAVVGDTSSGIYQERTIESLGAVASGGTANLTVWADNVNEALSSGFIEVSVIGNSQSAVMSHGTTFKILALRNASRTLTRYYVYGTEQARATGAGSGDLTEPFTPSLSVSGKDLVLTITAPARSFDNVVVTVNKSVAKTV